MAGEGESDFQVADIKPNIGSIIHADKSALLTGEYTSALRGLLEARGVLVFPGVHLTDQEQIDFTKTLGNFSREIFGDEIYKVTLDTNENARADYLKGAFYWHIDGTMSETPILASILSAKVLPATGGNTEFCNTYAAYEALSADRQWAIDGLRVKHAFWGSQLYHNPEPTLAKLEEWMALGSKELPLVWRHRSGRKSLVLGNSAQAVLDVDAEESAKILHGLREWATSEPFFYSHQWQAGDMVMWDNTGTMHRATPYDPSSGRLMHRTKLEGEEPFQ